MHGCSCSFSCRKERRIATRERMHIEEIALGDAEGRITLSQCTEAKVNALRRTMLSDIPSIAITKARIFENTSCFPDEYVAHRIGLVPLRGPLKTATLRVDKVGPAVVCGRDLQGDDGVRVVAPDSLIVELQEGERFHADLCAEVGTGAEHSRWCSAVAVRYSQRSRGAGLASSECFCHDTDFGARCGHCTGTKRGLNLRNAPLEFELRFETTGALTPAELIGGAIESLVRDLAMVRSSCEERLRMSPVSMVA